MSLCECGHDGFAHPSMSSGGRPCYLLLCGCGEYSPSEERSRREERNDRWSQAQDRGERNIYRYCGCGHKEIRHERGTGRCLIHNPSCACEEFRDIEEKDMSPQVTKTAVFTLGELCECGHPEGHHVLRMVRSALRKNCLGSGAGTEYGCKCRKYVPQPLKAIQAGESQPARALHISGCGCDNPKPDIPDTPCQCVRCSNPALLGYRHCRLCMRDLAAQDKFWAVHYPCAWCGTWEASRGDDLCPKCQEADDEKEEPTMPKITTTTTTSISSSDGFTIGDLQSFLDQVPRPQGLDTHVTVEYADPGEFVLSVTA